MPTQQRGGRDQECPGERKRKKNNPQPCSSSCPLPSWSQQSCPIKTDLVPKGVCVHLLSKERVGQEPQQIPLHLWFRDTVSNPKKLMIKGKLALPPKTLLQTQCPGALCPHAGARPHLQPSGAQRPSYRFHQQRKGEMLAKGGRGRGVRMGLQNLQDTSHP